MSSPAILTVNHFGKYQVRPRMGLYVVYDCGGNKPVVAKLSDGTPAVFACAWDSFLWVMRRIMRRIGQ